MTEKDLIAFEEEVATAFKDKKISGPVHLSGGNEKQLIEIFHDIDPDDWVFSTYRNHTHALLHGIPKQKVMEQIIAGHSMNLSFPERRFMTSAIVGGTLPIAVGVAAALKRKASARMVWCFVGDMCASTGAFHEATKYASGQRLPITFIVEDNALSCDSPTDECWGDNESGCVIIRYSYRRLWPHVGINEFVHF